MDHSKSLSDTEQPMTEEKSSGSKMLKKAKSFRDDIKTKIKRRPSTGAQQMIPENKSPKNKQSKAVSRTNSMNEGSKTDRSEDTDEADKLQMEVEEVNRTLNFIVRAVVTQGKHEVLPPSATLVLETVMNVFTLLSNHLLNQDSSKLASHHNKVCQCLAKFIRWSDSVLMKSEDDFNKETANEIIAALSDGIKDLTQLCIEKMASRKSSLPKSPTSTSGLQGTLEGSKRSSLPDIPLTPGERQILEQTSGMGIYDNATVSRSSEGLSNPTIFSFDVEDSPAPKPPLPDGANSILPRILGADVPDGDFPPPLPDKEKRRSGNMYDLMSSTTSTTSLTPTQSPQNSILISPTGEILTPFSQSPHSVSPMSHSPSSSVGSGLNKSTEDLIASAQRSSRTNSITKLTEGQVINSSSSSVMRSSTTQHTTFDEINSLTYKINQLTSSIDDKPPPIPSKQRIHRLMSTCVRSRPGRTTGVQCVLYVLRFQVCVQQDYGVPDLVLLYLQLPVSQSSQSTQSFMSVLTQKSASSSALLFCADRTSSQETYSSSETFSSATSHSSTESLPKPPPLPPKKRHIHAYMQTFGSYTQPSSLECISRHSINFYEAQWHQHQMELFQPLYPRSNTISVISDISNFSSDTSFSSGSPDRFTGLPALPIKMKRQNMNRQSMASTGSGSSQSDMSNSAGDIREKTVSLLEPAVTGPRPAIELDPKSQSAPATVCETIIPSLPKPAPNQLPHPSPVPRPEIQKDADSDFAELNPLDDVDVSDQLIRKQQGEDGPDIRGGSIDALVVHATAAGKSGSQGDLVNQEEFIYQEAFLTTYRTFIVCKELIDKLLYRFYKFQHVKDKKRLSRNAFSLLIRVVDELGYMELEEEVVRRMMDLVYELVCQGELMLARILRKKIIEKCEQRQKILADNANTMTPVQSIQLSQNLPDLLHFKSQEIAEQMTLMDAELFQKIEIPEVLLWAKEQSEELSPNLTHFTEHFNKMSYWCRTRILTQEDPKEREKYLIKFIKIMKHLRKMSNFNSYLAILSALDSAPVRRLEWQKQNLEALKEFCQLIDSSSSFRAYRQALSETEPPCIPYLGLILQDLTFINIGNQDLLPDHSINFSKRWQQFNILDSMRRFKKCNYEFKKSEKILSIINKFDDYLSEELLWQISEKIKPRGGRKKVETD
ncbi:LOW QUALITY PROTEIN: rap guanine nucleotide exchange factor 1-like [Haliotis rubra]|uniref:LOW QUALITY PROTEIN: rap guanine nucleotide exchange factor 1-like n=1 Tax=Haliotis rubra TaxID=36100 RepID=UPI001EE62E76|nr:LOW QUALITY PROTEIN: rap guanine nucleotide exchange factor 1-like [Haliotis rubra]